VQSSLKIYLLLRYHRAAASLPESCLAAKIEKLVLIGLNGREADISTPAYGAMDRLPSALKLPDRLPTAA